MRDDKYRKKLNLLASKGDRGYPRAIIRFYGPSKERAKKAVLEISDGEKLVFINEYNTNGYDLKWDPSFNKQAFLKIRMFNTQTLDLSNIVLGCHLDIDHSECKFWKNLPRINEFNFSSLTDKGLKYELEPDEDGNLNLMVFKPSNVPGNDIYKGDGCFVTHEGIEYQTNSHVVTATLNSGIWYYGVQSSYVPGPGPDEWFRETNEIKSMKHSILEYFFSNNSLMKREPVYFLVQKLRRIAEQKRNKRLNLTPGGAN
jgi:hypothetical protein